MQEEISGEAYPKTVTVDCLGGCTRQPELATVKRACGMPGRPLWIAMLFSGVWSLAQAGTLDMPNQPGNGAVKTASKSPFKTNNEGPYVGQRPPFTPDEFWKNILLLLRERDGYVTKERFEEVFAVHFTRTRDLGDSAFVYSIDYGKDWYFEVSLSSLYRGTRSGLNVGWFANTFGDWKKGECVQTQMAHQDIVDSGWALGNQERHNMEFNSYRKDDNQLVIYFAGNCVRGIKFTRKRP